MLVIVYHKLPLSFFNKDMRIRVLMLMMVVMVIMEKRLLMDIMVMIVMVMLKALNMVNRIVTGMLMTIVIGCYWSWSKAD